MTDAEIDGLSVVRPSNAERRTGSPPNLGVADSTSMLDADPETGEGASCGGVTEENGPVLSGGTFMPVKEEGLPDNDRGSDSA